MKAIIEVKDISNTQYLLQDEKYTILIPKKGICKIIEDKKDDRDCKNCEYYPIGIPVDQCISCTSDNNNFEPKEKEMNDKPFLTEEQFRKIHGLVFDNYNIGYWDKVKLAKEKNWIIEDKIEQAIENFIKYNGEGESNWAKSLDYEKLSYFVNQYRKANIVIELLQNKIKELEGK